MRTSTQRIALFAATAMTLALAGCGGGDDDNSGGTPPVGDGYTLGGSVSGLAANGRLVLQNNGGADLAVSANGGFTFGSRIAAGSAYAVTVSSQPAGQTCTVAQGSGTANGNVNSVAVQCGNLPPARYTVGGNVSGLAAGTSLTLQNNGGDDLAVGSNGGFTFPAALARGAAYAVTIRTQPAGQGCTVRNGSGTVGSTNVGAVEVACATSVALPDGDWQQDLCSQVRPNQWGRGLWRITRESETRVNVTLGLVMYSDASCSGTGTPAPGPVGGGGSFVLARTGSTATATAFWGTWTAPAAVPVVTPAVWARKGASLCILADSTPSVLPDAATVERTADLSIAGKGCYTRL